MIDLFLLICRSFPATFRQEMQESSSVVLVVLWTSGCIDAEGYLHILSRTDDIINVAGHRLSTGHIEEAIATHPIVAECCVFAVSDEIKGEVMEDTSNRH